MFYMWQVSFYICFSLLFFPLLSPTIDSVRILSDSFIIFTFIQCRPNHLFHSLHYLQSLGLICQNMYQQELLILGPLLRSMCLFAHQSFIFCALHHQTLICLSWVVGIGKTSLFGSVCCLPRSFLPSVGVIPLKWWVSEVEFIERICHLTNGTAGQMEVQRTSHCAAE